MKGKPWNKVLPFKQAYDHNLFKAMPFSWERIAQATFEPTVEHQSKAFVGDRYDLFVTAIKWFSDGEILLVHGAVGALEPSILNISIALRLNSELPAGRIRPHMPMTAICEIVAESFGHPFRLSPESPKIKYSLVREPLPRPIETPRSGSGITTFFAEVKDKVTRLSKEGALIFVLDVNRYLEWWNETAFGVAELPTIRKWSTAHRAPKVRRHEVSRDLAETLDQFCEELLDLVRNDETKEEAIHRWLLEEKHHVFLHPSATRVWSKVPFGGRVSDFVIKHGPAMYTLLEIERPSARIFTRRSGDPTREYSHARQQVMDWRQYLRNHVHAIHDQLGVDDLYEPHGMLVMSRDADIDSDEARRRWIDLRSDKEISIRTYDDLCHSVRSLANQLRSIVRS